MAKFHGKNLVVKVDNSSGSLQDISTDVREVTCPVEYDTADVSGFTEASKNYLPGQFDSQITLTGLMNPTSNRSHSLFTGILGGTAPRTIEVYPMGTAAGNPKFTGEVLCNRYEPTLGVTSAAGFSVSLVPADATGVTWTTA